MYNLNFHLRTGTRRAFCLGNSNQIEVSNGSLLTLFTVLLFLQYADEILNTLDQDGAITHRLYRQHTVQVKDEHSGATKHYIKDLGRTGRDLKHMIIIDNIKENFCRQPRNGIQITTWKDDPYDTELIYLQRLLLNMVK